MAAQFRPIDTIAVAFALLALGLGVGLPANIAFAVDCLIAPNSSTPPNGHWYYRTDRTQERRCWHLQMGNDQSEKGAVQTAREAQARTSQSVAAGPKDFVAQYPAAKLSNEDVENLYVEFLEWRGRTKN
jgi:hypothetical protein